MNKIAEGTNKKQSVTSKKSTASTTDDSLRHLAFDNSLQANIISTVSSGKNTTSQQCCLQTSGLF